MARLLPPAQRPGYRAEAHVLPLDFVDVPGLDRDEAELRRELRDLWFEQRGIGLRPWSVRWQILQASDHHYGITRPDPREILRGL